MSKLQTLQANFPGSMISNWLSAALARRSIHFGWAMIGVTFLTALLAAGHRQGTGVFIFCRFKEFGRPRRLPRCRSARPVRADGAVHRRADERYGLRQRDAGAQLVVSPTCLPRWR
jgi:hypothetical protein